MKAHERELHLLRLRELREELLRDPSPELTGRVGTYLIRITQRIGAIVIDLGVSE